MLSSRALSIPTSIPNCITSLVGERPRQAMQFPHSGRPPRSADPRPPQGSVTPLRSVPFSIAESAPFSIAVDTSVVSIGGKLIDRVEISPLADGERNLQ